LIENPSDPTVRSIYLHNFKALFDNNKTIPVQLLIEPLIKQIQASLGVNYQLKVFDFDFFTYIINHPKFQSQSSLLLFELLARITLNDTKR
jgi:hypothetical protein